MNDNTFTAISTRLRLARNIAGVPFPHKMNEADAARIAGGVQSALDRVGTFTRYDVSKMSQLQATALQERHIISADLIEHRFGSAFVSSDERASVMVNEEDHIREQAIIPGFALEKGYRIVDRMDDILAEKLDFAFSPRFGYLTSCATNLGTGMRASVMMFLPALTLTNKMDGMINDVSRLNMTVRGVYGEGSKAEGYLYQISNQITLGVCESEILDAVSGTIKHITERELAARELLRRDEPALKDKILRALGILTNAYMLTTSEAMQYLALVRLGAYYGYLSFSDSGVVDKLVTDCRPANMQLFGGSDMDPGARDEFRAKYLADALKKTCVKNI